MTDVNLSYFRNKSQRRLDGGKVMPIADDSSEEQLIEKAPGLLLELMQQTRDPEQIRKMLVARVRMELTSDDEMLMQECRTFARKRIKRHKHHTACIIRVTTDHGQKKFRRGLQKTYRRAATLERCSEEAALSDVDVRGGIIDSAVAMHYLPHYPEHAPSPVCPCPPCVERWVRAQEEQPDHPFGVIVPFEDQYVKIPPAWLSLFRYASDYASHIDPYQNGDS